MHLAKRGITTLVGAGAALLLAAGSAGAQSTTLSGETLTSPFDNLGTNGVCNATGASTLSFSATGDAAGPVPGTFSEEGTFTLASPTGPLTSFDATFTITPADGSAPVTGTKSLVGQGSGGCTEFSGFATTSASGNTSYSTSAPFNETGTAPVDLQQGLGTQSFTEGPFSPGAPGPKSKRDCKKGNYDQFGYKNQGQCVKAVNQSS